MKNHWKPYLIKYFFLIVFDVNIQTDIYVSFAELMLLTPIPEDSVIFWGSVWWRVFGGD